MARNIADVKIRITADTTGIEKLDGRLLKLEREISEVKKALQVVTKEAKTQGKQLEKLDKDYARVGAQAGKYKERLDKLNRTKKTTLATNEKLQDSIKRLNYLDGLRAKESQRLAGLQKERTAATRERIRQALALGVAIIGVSSAMSFLKDALQEGTQRADLLSVMNNRLPGFTQQMEAAKVATKGMVSELQIAKSAALMSSFGLDMSNIDSVMGLLTKTAIGTGQSLEFMLDSFARGVSRVSPLILDNLGIQVSIAEASQRWKEENQRLGTSLSKTEQQAAVMAESLRLLKENAEDVDLEGSLNAPLQKLAATWENFKADAGEGLARGFMSLKEDLEIGETRSLYGDDAARLQKIRNDAKRTTLEIVEAEGRLKTLTGQTAVRAEIHLDKLKKQLINQQLLVKTAGNSIAVGVRVEEGMERVLKVGRELKALGLDRKQVAAGVAKAQKLVVEQLAFQNAYYTELPQTAETMNNLIGIQRDIQEDISKIVGEVVEKKREAEALTKRTLEYEKEQAQLNSTITNGLEIRKAIALAELTSNEKEVGLLIEKIEKQQRVKSLEKQASDILNSKKDAQEKSIAITAIEQDLLAAIVALKKVEIKIEEQKTAEKEAQAKLDKAAKNSARKAKEAARERLRAAKAAAREAEAQRAREAEGVLAGVRQFEALAKALQDAEDANNAFMATRADKELKAMEDSVRNLLGPELFKGMDWGSSRQILITAWGREFKGVLPEAFMGRKAEFVEEMEARLKALAPELSKKTQEVIQKASNVRANALGSEVKGSSLADKIFGADEGTAVQRLVLVKDAQKELAKIVKENAALIELSPDLAAALERENDLLKQQTVNLKETAKAWENKGQAIDLMISQLERLATNTGSLVGDDVAAGFSGAGKALTDMSAAYKKTEGDFSSVLSSAIPGMQELTASVIDNQRTQAGIFAVMEAAAAFAAYPDVVGMATHGAAAVMYGAIAAKAIDLPTRTKPSSADSNSTGGTTNNNNSNTQEGDVHIHIAGNVLDTEANLGLLVQEGVSAMQRRRYNRGRA